MIKRYKTWDFFLLVLLDWSGKGERGGGFVFYAVSNYGYITAKQPAL